MKRVIFFLGSFDPLHLGHISIIENAIKKVNAEYLYIGLNKSSKKGKLTSFFHRKKMLLTYIQNKDTIKLLNFNFDYNNLEKTYKKLFATMEDNNENYILIGEDQLSSLSTWYRFEELKTKVRFIIATRNLNEVNKKNYSFEYITLNHLFPNISSSIVRAGNHNYTTKEISDYIKRYNIYLKEQVKPYLDKKRYLHSLSVAKTALKINKLGHLGLDPYKVEKAALLHDIAKNMSYEEAKNILETHYSANIDEEKEVIHQYMGEYLAKKDFNIDDIDILNAIKYHTTGRSNMSLLEKLIYVSDKIEPRRKYNTIELINACINDFNFAFITILKHNKQYIEKTKHITNKNTLSCFKYYL